MINKYIIFSSIGEGETTLTSFDNALLNLGIANYNLMKVSSILPANMTEMSYVNISEGNVLFTAYAAETVKELNDLISVAVAVGISENKNEVGVIMEFTGHCSKEEAELAVKQMVTEAMQTRKSAIKHIFLKSASVRGNGNKYVTAFSAIAMWEYV